MSEAHRRKKQPIEVRRQLLDVTARLCVEHGFSGLTLDAVSREAGVSKGGLLHHFPSKQALLDALCDTMIEGFDQRIDEIAAGDPDPHGRFTRAYLLANAEAMTFPGQEHWTSLAFLMMAQADMRSRWRQWMAEHIARVEETDGSIACSIARLASDGLWLSDLFGTPGVLPERRQEFISTLIEMTKKF